MSYREIPGWSHDILPAYEMFARMIPRGGTFVEVGVFLGRSLAYMGELRPDLQLWAVDPWEDGANPPGYLGMGEYAYLQDEYGGLFPAFLGLMQKHSPAVLKRTHVIRARSCDVTLPMADMIFIDGEHDYDNVIADIDHWVDRVKRGGIFAGHDYQPDYPGVKLAVDAQLGEPTMGPVPAGEWSSVWWFQR